MIPLLRRLLLISLCAIWPACSDAVDTGPRVNAGHARAAQANPATWPQRHPRDILDLLHARQFDILDNWLNSGQERYEQGKLDEFTLASAFSAFERDSDPDSRKLFDEWIAQHPRSYAARLARGLYYMGNGWRSRGEKYASETPRHHFEKMAAFFALARADLEQAATLTPKPTGTLCALMEIAGTSSDRNQLDALLDRALALDPSALTPRLKQLRFLEPRWGGSFAAMENFAASHRIRTGLDEKQTKLLAGAILSARATALEQTTTRNPGEKKQNQAAALTLVEQALALVPNDTSFLSQKAQLLAQQERHEEALRLFDQAIERKYYPKLYYSRAEVHAKLHHAAAALADYQMAAELSVVAAQQQLGWAYRMGSDGLRKNPAAALAWFRRVAIWGDTWAQLMIGDLVREGANGRPDPAEAVRWYRLAAEGGYAPAQTNLGSMYWNGAGIKQNRWEAMRWWRYAAKQGDVDAKRNIDHLLNPLDKVWMFIAESLLDPWQPLTDAPMSVAGRLFSAFARQLPVRL